MKRLLSILIAVGLLCATSVVKAESDLMCGRLREAAPADEKPAVERKYAPDRLVDVLHLSIDVTPDFQRRTIRATTIIRFRPKPQPR